MMQFNIKIKVDKEDKLSPLFPFINVLCNALIEFMSEKLTEEEIIQLGKELQRNKRNHRKEVIKNFLKEKMRKATKESQSSQQPAKRLDLSKYDDLL